MRFRLISRSALAVFGVTIGLNLCGARSKAESYPPFVAYRAVDVDGNNYATLTREGEGAHVSPYGPVKITIVTRGNGKSTVTEGMAAIYRRDGFDEYETRRLERVTPRSGDKVLGELILDRPPGKCMIFAKDSGILLLDTYGPNYSLLKNDEPAVQLYSLTGRLIWSNTLRDIFDAKRIESFPRSLSGDVDFWRTAWLDDQMEEVVIIPRIRAAGGTDLPAAVVVSARTGRVRSGGPEDIIRVVDTANRGGLLAALDLVLEAKTKIRDGSLEKIATSPECADGARLRASVLLFRQKNQMGRRAFLELARKLSALEDEDDDAFIPGNIAFRDSRRIAVEYAKEVLGVDGLGVLRDCARNMKNDRSLEAAFVSLGEPAVPVLLDILRQEKSPGTRVMAVSALGQIKVASGAVLDALVGALSSREGDELSCSVRVAAARALGNLGTKGKPALAPLRERWKDADDDFRQAIERAIRAIEQK